MEEYVIKDLSKLLKNEALNIRRSMKLTDSNVGRVYDRNLEQIPVTIELYGPYARVVDFSDAGMSEEDITVVKDIVSRFLYIEKDNVIFKERRKREGKEQHERTDESLIVSVKENGLSFECELLRYADTGLFLDQVNTRSLVRENSAGRRVLNLFCYTGSFSVYAASGNAESVVSVDLSNVYTAWARRNLTTNGFLDEKKYSVVAEDARLYLTEAIERGERYDLVIFDPPAFSNSRKADTFDVQRDYLEFFALISKVLVKDGALIFAENLSGFQFDRGRVEPYYSVREITRDIHAEGFASKKGCSRVWIAEKKEEMKLKSRASKREREMDGLKDEELGRLTLSFGDEESSGTARGKREPRAFSSDDVKEEKSERRGRRPAFKDENMGRRDRGFSRDSRSSYERNDRYSRRDSDRREFSRDRDDRYSRRDSDRYSTRDRDDRFSRRDSDRREFSRDREDRYSRREGDRYSSRDRDDRYSSRSDRREFSRDRDERYSRRDGDRYSTRDREDRFSRDRYSSRGREDRYSSRDDRRDGENEISRLYRGAKTSSTRDRDGKKKSGPKPFGYDSFMETKLRDKATAFWLSGQEGNSNKSEE